MNVSELLIACRAPDTEKHILGAVLFAGSAGRPEDLADVSHVLAVPPEDYTLEKNAAIAAAMRALDDARQPIDMLTVHRQLIAMGKRTPEGELDPVLQNHLFEVQAEVVSTANCATHAAHIRDLARRRRFIIGSMNVIEKAGNPEKPMQEVEAEAEAVLMGAHEEKAQEGLIPMRKIVQRGGEEFAARIRGVVSGVLTGLQDIDRNLLGLRASQVTILAARPAMGKSALALQWGKYVAETTGMAVPIFTLEMLVQEQLERLLAQEDGRLDSYLLSDKFELDRYQHVITEIMGRFANLPIWMNESSNITPPDILRQCREIQRKHPKGIGLVIVDYLQLVEAHGKHETREREVNYVSKYLKRIANELRVPLVAVASLSRSCDAREDKRPLLSDLRESGQIESDAHKVLFLYRDEVYKACEENRGVAELLIRKNKGGRTGMVPLVFRDRETRFYDMDKNSKDAYASFLEGKAQRKADREEARREGGTRRGNQTPTGDGW